MLLKNVKKFEFGKGKESIDVYLTLDLIPIHVNIKYNFNESYGKDIFGGKSTYYYQPDFINNIYTLDVYQQLIDKLCELLNIEKRTVFCTYNIDKFNIKEYDKFYEYQFIGGYNRTYYTNIKINTAIKNWDNVEYLEKINNVDDIVEYHDKKMFIQIKNVLKETRRQNVFNIFNYHFITNKTIEKYINGKTDISKNIGNMINGSKKDNKIQTFIIGEGNKTTDIHLTLDLIPIHLHLKYKENNKNGITLKFINKINTIKNYQTLINLVCDYLGLGKKELLYKKDLPKFNFRNDDNFYEYQYSDNFDRDYYTKSNLENSLKFQNEFKLLFSSDNYRSNTNNNDFYKLYSRLHIIFNYIRKQGIFTRNDDNNLSDSTLTKFKKYKKWSSKRHNNSNELVPN